MKYSLQPIIYFLPLFCNCQFRRLDSIQILCSQAHVPAGSVSKLDSTTTASFGTLPYNHFARTTGKTQDLYCWKGVFTVPLHSNGNYLIVSCVFIAARMCLQSHCLAMNVYSGFAIPASGRHVTIILLLANLV
jgi:hypothetical protein